MQQLSKTGERAWIALLRVAPHLMETVEAALKAEGFPPLAWYDVLWELERAGAPLRQRDLGERLLVARYNLSRLLDRLETDRLIERQPCVDDARGFMLSITRAGKALRQKMWPVYAEAIAAALDRKLTTAEADTLAKLLDKLR
ncbi:MAG TPA: MarR family transcriptional regulator [Caulobacterales bacterium]|nr:MarR family transcriptional regulator [Caulobacterales bacterium]